MDETQFDLPVDDFRLIKAQKRAKLRQYIATTSVSLGAVCCGTVLAWSSPALAQLTNNETTSSIVLTDRETAWVGGILPIGALIAAMPAGFLADQFGRKTVILVTTVLFLMNWLFIIFARNTFTILIGRFLAGIAMGAICVAAPVYIGEIAEPSIRGTLGSFFQLFLAFGVLLTNIVGSFTNWTLLSVILALIAIVFGVSFLFMPESPVFLIKSGKFSQGRKSLMTFREHSKVDLEIKMVQKEMENACSVKVSLMEICSLNKGTIRALFAGVGVLIFQQLSGINAVVFYTVSIFETAGSKLDPSVCAIIMSIVQVGASYISIIVIEKLNRKTYLMLSSAGMMLSLAALGMYFHLLNVKVPIESLNYLPITALIVYMVSFSFGYGPIPWMLLGELYSSEVKGLATGLAILMNWSCAFFVTFFFPILKQLSGDHLPFYIFAIFMGASILFVYFIVPETRGKSLAEIQNNLNK